MAVERNKLEPAVVRTAVHGAAKGRVSAVNHFIDIFHIRIPGVESINNFFIMVFKNFPKDIHKAIMQKNVTKRTP